MWFKVLKIQVKDTKGLLRILTNHSGRISKILEIRTNRLT